MFKLIENEVFKIIYKKRLLMVLGILFLLTFAFAYGQTKSMERTQRQLSERFGQSTNTTWQQMTEQQIIDLKSHLDSPYTEESRKSSYRIRIEQLQYSISNNINPLGMSSAKFTTRFMEQSIYLFLPLLIILLAADMVSGEATNGTIKLLLVRSVPRWKVLLSKYASLIIMNVILILLTLILSYIISGFFFGFGGWWAPIATGFKIINGQLDTSSVINVPQWQYTLMVYSLGFYVSLVVGTISFMISVLVKTTATSIGIMMSCLISGSFLSYFLPDWKIIRYFFSVNLRLTDYLSGSGQIIEGMNMNFSVLVLFAWLIGGLIVSFVYFTKQDVLV